MATTPKNVTNVNQVEPCKIKIVNTLPALKNAELGEMFLLMDDADGETKVIHIRIADGWLKSATMST